MGIVKAGYDGYLIRCNHCGDETSEIFSSKVEAMQFIDDNEEGWIYDDENGIICSSCRNHMFDCSNNKYNKKAIPRVKKPKIITIEEDKLRQYLQDKENEIIEYYELQYDNNIKNIMNKVVLSLFNQNVSIKTIYNAFKEIFNVSEDFIYKIIEDEVYNKKYGINETGD